MTEEQIFLTALDIPVGRERQAYLDRACGADTELRSQVEGLLQAGADAGSFLEHPPADLEATMAHPDESDAEAGQAPAALLASLEPCETPGRCGRLGVYEIIEVVGRGGMGAVLRAVDTKLNRVVAVKVMAAEIAANPTAVKRFMREAQMAAAVVHDHVVTIHAVDDVRDVPFLVMEFVAGQSLQQKIDRQGALRLQEILQISMQTAAGLAAAHKQGLIHRDVKPANILLENGVQRVKITDFGLARAGDDVQITKTGHIAGTPLYMSPEQALGQPVDGRSDLFSLGSVMYTMCTGRAAFRADSAVAVLRRVCDDTPRPIREVNSEIPEWLAVIVGRLLAKKPEGRYQAAAEVAELLRGALAHVQQPDLVPRPELPVPSPAAPARRAGWGWAALALLAMAGVSLWRFGPPASTRTDPEAPTTADSAGLSGDSALDESAGASAPPTEPFLSSLALAPFDADEARRLQDAWARRLKGAVETTNSLGMKLRLIPPGEFQITRESRVRISQVFRMSAHETTVGQFRAFVTATGHRTEVELSGEGGIARLAPDAQVETKPEFIWSNPLFARSEETPVCFLGWSDAVAFCTWLSTKEQATYRLPTEAEWEWACRAGTLTPRYYGDDSALMGNYGWMEMNAEGFAHPIGGKIPNRWGLYDLYGNAAEYCSDWHAPYPAGHLIDPQGPDSGSQRAIRGAGFIDSPEHGSESRFASLPGTAMFHFGFRVVREE